MKLLDGKCSVVGRHHKCVRISTLWDHLWADRESAVFGDGDERLQLPATLGLAFAKIGRGLAKKTWFCFRTRVGNLILKSLRGEGAYDRNSWTHMLRWALRAWCPMLQEAVHVPVAGLCGGIDCSPSHFSQCVVPGLLLVRVLCFCCVSCVRARLGSSG